MGFISCGNVLRVKTDYISLCICKKRGYRKLLRIFSNFYQKMKLMEWVMFWMWRIFLFHTNESVNSMQGEATMSLSQAWLSDLEKPSAVLTSLCSWREYPLMPGGCGNCQASSCFKTRPVFPGKLPGNDSIQNFNTDPVF